MMTTRERSYFISGLRSLGKITLIEKDIHRIYRCICGSEVAKGKVVGHFRGKHIETFTTIKTLIHTWGLIEDSGSIDLGIEGSDNEREENIQIDLSRLI